MLRLAKEGIKAGLIQPKVELQKRTKGAIRPLFIDYAVTWRCNAKCIMCDMWQSGKENPDLKAQELSADELRQILRRDNMFIKDIKKIGLTGGEPFLRNDIPEIVRAFQDYLPEARISLVCNGLLTKRILEALKEIKTFKPDLVFSVSLDGLGETHDKVRGMAGFYDAAMNTMQGAKDLGFTVTSGMVISHINYDQITAVSEALEKMGVDFSCNMQERGANFNNDGQADDMTPEMDAEVVRQLEKFKHHYYMDNVRRQLMGEKRTLPCYAGHTSYFMKPDGEVSYCNLMGEPLGNLREQSFKQIATAESTWKMREKLANCTCWSQCEVKNSAATAPLHVLRWLKNSDDKAAFFKHYKNKF